MPAGTGARLRPVRDWPAHDKGICALAWSPAGAVLASGGNEGGVRLWEARSGRRLLGWDEHDGAVRCLAWSPDGRLLASAGEDGVLAIREAAGGRAVRRHRDHGAWINSASWSPDGRLYASASGDRTLRVYDAGSHEPVRELVSPFGTYMSIAWSPDGAYLAAASRTDALTVWRTRDWRPHRRIDTGHGVVWNVEWQPGGRLLATCGRDGRIALRDPDTGDPRVVIEGHVDTVARVSFSPDGALLASLSHDETASLWRAADGTRLGHVPKIYPGWVYCLAFGPRGRLVAVPDEHGGRIRIVRVEEVRAPAPRPVTARGARRVWPPLGALKRIVLEARAAGRLWIDETALREATGAMETEGRDVRKLLRCAVGHLRASGDVLPVGDGGRLLLRTEALPGAVAAAVAYARAAPPGDGTVPVRELPDAVLPPAGPAGHPAPDALRRLLQQALSLFLLQTRRGWLRRTHGQEALVLPEAAARPLPQTARAAIGAGVSFPGAPREAASRLFFELVNGGGFSAYCLFEDALALRAGDTTWVVHLASRPDGAAVDLSVVRWRAGEAPRLRGEDPVVALAAASLGAPQPGPGAHARLPGPAPRLHLPWLACESPAPAAPDVLDGETPGPIRAAIVKERADDEAARQERLCLLPERLDGGRFDLVVLHAPEDLGSAGRLEHALLEWGLLARVDEGGGSPEARAGLVELADRVGVIAVLVGKAMAGPFEAHAFYPAYRALAEQRAKEAPRLRWVPVLLPDAPTRPVLPDFLHSFDWHRWREEGGRFTAGFLAGLVSSVLVDRSRS